MCERFWWITINKHLFMGIQNLPISLQTFFQYERAGKADIPQVLCHSALFLKILSLTQFRLFWLKLSFMLFWSGGTKKRRRVWPIKYLSNVETNSAWRWRTGNTWTSIPWTSINVTCTGFAGTWIFNWEGYWRAWVRLSTDTGGTGINSTGRKLQTRSSGES